MITEDYCSPEVAKLLEEKEFDEEISTYYLVHPSGFPEFFNKKDEFVNPEDVWLKCPTHQMAMKWLREMHNIIIVIEPHMYDYVNERNASYVCSIWVGDNYYENPISTDYPTFEETVDAALKYILKNLI